MVTPVKAGSDVVTITGCLRKETYKVFVSPAVFPESGAAPLAVEEGSAGEILFLDIPWGSSYPEAKSILQGQGKKVKAPAQRNDYIRAVVDGEVLFSACTAEMAALEFSYEPGTTDFKEKNSFFRGVLYFSPDTPFDQIRLAVRSIYGLDNGELQDGVCTWKKDGVVLKLTPKDKNTVLEFYQE